MLCSVCAHDMTLLHDGDGTETDPFICRAVGCQCAFVLENGDPVIVLLDDRG